MKRVEFKSRMDHLPSDKGGIDVCLITVKDAKTGTWVIHPLSQYVVDNYFGKSVMTMKAATSYICQFLNWYADEHDDLSELSIDDVRCFLAEMSADCKQKTNDHRSTFIVRFAYYLCKHGIGQMDPEEFVVNKFRGRTCVRLAYEVSIPRVRKPEAVTKIKTIEPKYVFDFIDTAIRVAPRIAFAVILSFTGGLRAGELMNLDQGAVSFIGPYGRDGFVIDVRNRFLREDISTGSVKKERIQRAFPLPGGIAAKVAKLHFEKYVSKTSSALFCNEKGQAMTVGSYRYLFNKIKRAFIQTLKESGDPAALTYALVLESKRWSTHIGRGFFSNTVTVVCDNNPGLLAAMRGDSSPTSPIPYMDDAIMDEASKVLDVWYKDVFKEDK